MSDHPVSNFLNLLRLIKRTGCMEQALQASIGRWAGETPSPATMLRIAAYICDLCDDTLVEINSSTISDEAKAGLLQTAQSVQTLFSVPNMANAPNHFLPQIDGSITQFAILVSVAGLDEPNPVSAEIDELVAEIVSIEKAISEAGVSPAVAEVARRHLHVLKTLLQNVDALGIDAALAAYDELVIRLRRVDEKADPGTHKKMRKVWPMIEKWSGRLAVIHAGLSHGSGMITGAYSAAKNLLGWSPD